MDDDRLTSLLGELRAKGGRVTSARRALLAALIGSDGHLTAEDLAESVRKLQPDVHLSTVYRALDALEALGVVDHVHLGHGRAIYHLADSAHHHLVCESCGRVVEIEPSVLAPLALRLRDDHGFSVRTRHFALVGLCSDCSQVGSGVESQ